MKIKKFAEEFKAFIAKGNVVDMAVAVIIGGAFGKIVTSLVSDIIMPVVGIIVGKISVSDMKWVISEAVPAKPEILDEAGNVIQEATAEVAEVALRYGAFIQTVIDFLIIALSVFIMLKIVLGAKDKLTAKQRAEAEAKEAEEAAKAEAEKAPTAEELLTEIRDLLAEKK